jgi:hypothetical protein
MVKTSFERKHYIEIMRIIPLGEFPTIERKKQDFLIEDTEFTFYLIRPDSKFYDELKMRSLQ